MVAKSENKQIQNNAGFFEKFFELTKHKTNVKTETIAGITTFMTMAYILIVNPMILADAGMDYNAVFTATVISSVVATLVMALYAKLPFALAPGMGLNAFFTYYVVIGMGKTWEFALTAILLEGIIFLILTFFNVREAIMESIPNNIKKAISVGIGLFIAFIGFSNAGIIVQGQGTPLALGHIMDNPGALVALFGIIIIGILLAKEVKGAIFIGIIAATALALPMGVTSLPTKLISLPAAPLLFKFDFSGILTIDMLLVLFVFLFVDMFDTIGTLIGVSTKSGMVDENGKVPNVKKALFADAIGTTVGACLGTSTVTTFVESAAGVAEGGRTGLTSLVTAGCFAVALFFSPLFGMVPGAATAPALIIVGLFMLSPIKEIDLEDYTEAIPAFLTIIMMPLTYSISDGIVFGILSYILLKTLSGKTKDVSIMTLVVGIFFVLKIVFFS
jgi:AGZA family xanthine/uracil permease-like MFS transporter